MRAVIPPAAPLPPVAGGERPYFSAEIGAWRTPHHTAERPRQRSVPGAAKRRPGNLTLAQRCKIWLAVILYCATCWGLFAWLVHDLYLGGGL